MSLPSSRNKGLYYYPRGFASVPTAFTYSSLRLPPLPLLVLSSLLAITLIMPPPVAMAACHNPFTYNYSKVTYNNPAEGWRSYVLYDVDGNNTVTEGCLNTWLVARAVCERDGLELAPQGEPQSLEAVTELCAKRNRYMCWMDGVPGRNDYGRCYLLSQRGEVLEQGCEQQMRFVCRQKELPLPSQVTTSPVTGVLSLASRGYNYTMYDALALTLMNYDSAAAFCQRQKGELVPYWDASSGALSVVAELCAKRRYTCWVRRSASTPVGKCPLMDINANIQEQGCQQRVRFVCRKLVGGAAAASCD